MSLLVLLATIAVAVLCIGGFIVLPVLLIMRFIKNPALSPKQRSVWVILFLLFFPFSAYVYAILEEKKPAYLYASIAMLVIGALAIAYQIGGPGLQ
ncbi:MAG: hypothetical protein JO089_05690 [Alphaproteobacteria bacterium]|nr:hypothetical protein [Alphaproteobacteria bacterium]